MQSQDLAKIVDILTREVELLRKLHSALVDEQSFLVQGDVQGIRDRVEGQIEVIKRLAALEDERKAAFKSICPGRPADSDIKFETILDLSEGAHADRLRALRTSMAEVLKSLGEVNRQNDVLIRQSLAYVKRMLRALAGENANTEMYTSKGSIKSATGRIAVDHRA